MWFDWSINCTFPCETSSRSEIQNQNMKICTTFRQCILHIFLLNRWMAKRWIYLSREKRTINIYVYLKFNLLHRFGSQINDRCEIQVNDLRCFSCFKCKFQWFRMHRSLVFLSPFFLQIQFRPFRILISCRS